MTRVPEQNSVADVKMRQAGSGPTAREDLRARYLQALGIGLWVARRPLPGAARSSVSYPRVEAPSAFEAETPEPEAVSAPRRASDLSVGLSRPVGPASAPAKPDDQAEDLPAPDASPPRPPSGAPVPGTLEAFLVVGSGKVLLTDHDPAVPEKLQRRLVGQICRSLGMTDPEVTPVGWPPFANPDVPGSGPEGLERVFDQLLSQIERASPWMLMGRQAEELRPLLEALDVRIQAAFAHGPAELMADPSFKAALWQMLLDTGWVTGH